jgi:succinate dehydrogenase / fumarate reductase membrane anchor subunit
LRKAVSGLRAWLVQRMSAVYMLFFIIFLLTHFILDPPKSYLVWRDWMLSPNVSIAASVFLAALLAHTWVGIRDVIMDYVHPVAIRVGALALLALGLAWVGAWAIRVLWLVHV